MWESVSAGTCTWTSAFFVQEPKQSVNEGRNHCRESLSHSSSDSKRTPVFMVSFCSQKFLLYQYKTSERKYLAKDNRKCKVPILYIALLQYIYEAILYIASKFPFYILHYLTSLIKFNSTWWSSTLLPWQPAGIEVVSTHLNVLSRALSRPSKQPCIPCKASTMINLIHLAAFLTIPSRIQHTCLYFIRI